MRFCSVHWSGVFWLLLLGLGRKWGFFRHEIWPFLSFVWLWNCWVLIGILVTFPFTLCMISLSRSSLTEEFFFLIKGDFFCLKFVGAEKKVIDTITCNVNTVMLTYCLILFAWIHGILLSLNFTLKLKRNWLETRE